MKKIKSLPFVYGLIFSLMIIIFTATYLYITVNNKSLLYMKNNIEEYGGKLSVNIEEQFNQIIFFAETFSKAKFVQDGDYKGLSDTFSTMKDMSSSISNIYIVKEETLYDVKKDESSTIAGNNLNELKSKYSNLNKAMLFEDYTNERAFIISYIDNQDSNNAFMVFEVDIKSFFQNISNTDNNLDKIYFILDEEGKTVFNSKKEYLKGTNYDSVNIKKDIETLFESFEVKKKGYEFKDENHIYKSISYNSIGNGKYSTAVVVNYRPILRIMNTVGNVCKNIVIISMILIIVCIYKHCMVIYKKNTESECCATTLEGNNKKQEDVSDENIEGVEGHFKYLIHENRRLVQEVEEYDNLKNEFFSNISHELKTPLNVLFSTVQLLPLYMGKELTPKEEIKVERYFSVMRQNGYRLLRVVNNLIYITRLDAGLIDLHLNNYNIVEVVEEIIACAVPYAHKIDRSIIFDTDVEEVIMAVDKGKIERIILNFISNAFKFSSFGDCIDVTLKKNGNNVTISVKDTGFGIPVNKQEIIFERFRQVDKLYNREKEGTGIGLSIVKSLVELHGGEICVKSILGVGSEFIIEIPIVILKDEQCNVDSFMYENNVEKAEMEFSDIEF
ncbi:MAG: sensor histidine kinase [Clostridium sp.]